MSKQKKDEMGSGVIGLIILWTIVVLIVPHVRRVDISSGDANSLILTKPLDDWNVDGAQLMYGSNLRIFVPQSKYEALSYQEKEALIADFANAWCSKAAGFFLPSVYLRDTQSGKALDSKLCLL